MKKDMPPLDVVFEDEFVAGVKDIFEKKIVFNEVLGLKIASMTPTLVTATIDMRHELVGHFSYNRIHGGVISACLDTMGGLACMAAMGARHMDEPPAQRIQRFAKLGMQSASSSTGELDTLLKQELALWSRVVKDGNIKPE